MSNNDWKEKLNFVYSTNPDFKPLQEEVEKENIPAEKQKIRVSLDKKNRGGKLVTIVSGYQGDETELKELGKTLKSKCGVGGTTKDSLIIIQGDFRDRIINLLQEMGYKDVKRSGG